MKEQHYGMMEMDWHIQIGNYEIKNENLTVKDNVIIKLIDKNRRVKQLIKSLRRKIYRCMAIYLYLDPSIITLSG